MAKAALEEWKDAQTRTPEAQMQYQLQALSHRLEEAEERCALAIAAKHEFREQALALAEQLASAREAAHSEALSAHDLMKGQVRGGSCSCFMIVASHVAT